MRFKASASVTGICLAGNGVQLAKCQGAPADIVHEAGSAQAASSTKVNLQSTCRSRYLDLSSSADWSRTGSLAGRGLGVRARGPVDTELTDPSGVRVRGEQVSMKACDPIGVTSVDPVIEEGCHVCRRMESTPTTHQDGTNEKETKTPTSNKGHTLVEQVHAAHRGKCQGASH